MSFTGFTNEIFRSENAATRSFHRAAYASTHLEKKSRVHINIRRCFYAHFLTRSCEIKSLNAFYESQSSAPTERRFIAHTLLRSEKSHIMPCIDRKNYHSVWQSKLTESLAVQKYASFDSNPTAPYSAREESRGKKQYNGVIITREFINNWCRARFSILAGVITPVSLWNRPSKKWTINEKKKKKKKTICYAGRTRD